MQANSVIDDLQKLDPAKFNMSQPEMDNFIAQNKALRAWFYIRLLDAFRNVPLAVSPIKSKNSVGQVTPQELFSFIETELKTSIEALPAKMVMPERDSTRTMDQSRCSRIVSTPLSECRKWIGT